jgi:hypothetical protein
MQYLREYVNGDAFQVFLSGITTIEDLRRDAEPLKIVRDIRAGRQVSQQRAMILNRWIRSLVQNGHLPASDGTYLTESGRPVARRPQVVGGSPDATDSESGRKSHRQPVERRWNPADVAAAEARQRRVVRRIENGDDYVKPIPKFRSQRRTPGKFS